MEETNSRGWRASIAKLYSGYEWVGAARRLTSSWQEKNNGVCQVVLECRGCQAVSRTRPHLIGGKPHEPRCPSTSQSTRHGVVKGRSAEKEGTVVAPSSTQDFGLMKTFGTAEFKKTRTYDRRYSHVVIYRRGLTIRCCLMSHCLAPALAFETIRVRQNFLIHDLRAGFTE